MNRESTWVLWSSDLCPFAHRTRALLRRLDIPHERRDTGLWIKDPEFVAQSPTRKVPLLIDGDIRLSESAVIADYVVEAHGWSEAYPGDAASRAQQRLVMKQWDDSVIPLAYYRAIRGFPFSRLQPAPRAVESSLDELEALVASDGGFPVDSLLGIHVGVFWARFRRIAYLVPLVQKVNRERPALATWLDCAADLPYLTATADLEAFARSYRRQIGLVGAAVAASGGLVAVTTMVSAATLVWFSL